MSLFYICRTIAKIIRDRFYITFSKYLEIIFVHWHHVTLSWNTPPPSTYTVIALCDYPSYGYSEEILA